MLLLFPNTHAKYYFPLWPTSPIDNIYHCLGLSVFVVPFLILGKCIQQSRVKFCIVIAMCVLILYSCSFQTLMLDIAPAVLNIANRHQIALTWALYVQCVISEPGVIVSNNLLPNCVLVLLFVFYYYAPVFSKYSCWILLPHTVIDITNMQQIALTWALCFCCCCVLSEPGGECIRQSPVKFYVVITMCVLILCSCFFKYSCYALYPTVVDIDVSFEQQG